MKSKELSLIHLDIRDHWFWDKWPFTAAMLWPLWLLVAVIIALAIRG